MTEQRSTKGLFPCVLDGLVLSQTKAAKLCRLSMGDVRHALLDDPSLSTSEAVRVATRERKARPLVHKPGRPLAGSKS